MSLHPTTQTIYEFIDIFKELGFIFYNGPEIDTEWKILTDLGLLRIILHETLKIHFGCLKILRDWKNQDQWKRILPRPHTSNCQIQYMNNHVPPIRIVYAGKTFRNEATDATHEAEFHQFELMCIDEQVSMSDLKNTLTYAFKKFFGDDIQVRFRASYFPFTKPSFEVDILWKDKWLEVCGGGMMHPEVLENGFKDNEKMNIG